MFKSAIALHIQTAVALATVALVAGCKSPQTRIAHQVANLETRWTTNIVQQQQLPIRALDWPSALAELKANNLKLRQARTEVTNAQEAVRQVFRDLVPSLNLHAGISKRVVDLPSVGANDVSFSADSIFYIPGLMSFGARLYMSRLYRLRVEAAYALTERQQVIELYKLFWAAQEIQEQARYAANGRKTAQAYEKVDPFAGQLMLTETELREVSGLHESESLQQRASDLLGSRDFRWALLTNGLPDLRYDLDPLPLTDTNRVAQLQIRLAAIELEAARAELTGIKLRYWPELNIFVSGPPLYQRSFGQEEFWKADALRASADAFWMIDTRGYISRQLRQTKRQQALQQERLRQESLSLMQKLVFTQTILSTIHEKERDLEQQLAVLEAIPPAQNLASIQKYATDYQTTVDQLRQVRRESAELKALFWFVDEAAWTDTPPVTPLAVN
jgi:hypothetical protein